MLVADDLDVPALGGEHFACSLGTHTTLGNVKNAIHGTYHAIAHKHLPRYLAEFCWRFNRRFDLANLLPRVIQPKLESPHDA